MHSRNNKNPRPPGRASSHVCKQEHACSDDGLDHVLVKSISGSGDDDDERRPGIWAQHPNLWIRRLVELFTRRGQTRLQAMQDALAHWLDGTPDANISDAYAPSAAGVGQWSEQELERVRAYLQSLPRAVYTLQDWELVVDYLAHRYLNPADLKSDVEWFATRTSVMGKIAANWTQTISAPIIDALVASLPLTVITATNELGLTGAQQAIVEFGRLRCAELVTALSETARHRLKHVILDHQMRVLQHDPSATRAGLDRQLFDTFGVLNPDWRRIAVTEAGENANQGVIASLAPGTKVRRIEQYAGACTACRRIDGRIMTIVDSAKHDKNGDEQVWMGKNNVGRAAAPSKRVDGVLVERTDDELWWIPAGLMHPHCRGSWHVLDGSAASTSEKFQSWLDGNLHLAGKPT